MKPTVVSADVLFEDHRAQLKWEWVAGLGASERRRESIARPGATRHAPVRTWKKSSGSVPRIDPQRYAVCILSAPDFPVAALPAGQDRQANLGGSGEPSADRPLVVAPRLRAQACRVLDGSGRRGDDLHELPRPVP